jgi:hypothetical protein
MKRDVTTAELQAWATLWTQIDKYVRACGGEPSPPQSRVASAIAARIEVAALGLSDALVSGRHLAERAQHQHATLIGLQAAKARGARLGRPRNDISDHWIEDVANGLLSAKQVAELKGISPATVKRRVLEYRARRARGGQ